MAYATRWSGGFIKPFDGMFFGPKGHPTDEITPFVDFPMQAAVLSGMTAKLSPIVQQTPYNCPSGNCTFPEFYSLAMCSSCADVSDKVETVQSAGVTSGGYPGPSYKVARWSLSPRKLRRRDDFEAELVCNEIPGHLQLCNFEDMDSGIETSRVMVARSTNRPSQTVRYQNHTTLMISLLTIRGQHGPMQEWRG